LRTSTAIMMGCAVLFGLLAVFVARAWLSSQAELRATSEPRPAAIATRNVVVAASPVREAAGSGPARLLASGRAALWEFGPLLAGSDQAPASAPLVRGHPAFHLLLHRTGRFHRGLLYPAGMSL